MSKIVRRVAFALGSTALLVVAPAAWAVTEVPTYHYADSGSTVTVHVGHEFRIKLATAYDGGYSWAITQHPDSAVLKLERKRLVADPHPPGTVGFGYHTIFRYAVVGRGKTSLTLTERRTFGVNRVLKRFTLTVKTHS